VPSGRATDKSYSHLIYKAYVRVDEAALPPADRGGKENQAAAEVGAQPATHVKAAKATPLHSARKVGSASKVR
jgi:hypothetical protein